MLCNVKPILGEPGTISEQIIDVFHMDMLNRQTYITRLGTD